MQPFTVHRGRVAPLLQRDVDTDQIIPKQFLKSIDRHGFARGLFYNWRTNADGTLNESFTLNDPRYAGATILVTGPNFGCGSSREHAAWALSESGFRAVIAPSFADIFRANAVTNGLLPLVLPDKLVGDLAERVEGAIGYELTIDLERCRVVDDAGLDVPFVIDGSSRMRLLEGLDDIGIILQNEADITRYEAEFAR